MGTSTTIIKPEFPLHEWLNSSMNGGKNIDEYDHIGGWRITCHYTVPFNFNLNEINSKAAFIFFAVKTKTVEKESLCFEAESYINELIEKIDPLSYRCCVQSRRIDTLSYALYVFVGKETSIELKMTAIQSALHLHNALNSKERINSICNGNEIDKKRNSFEYENEMELETEDVHILQFMTNGCKKTFEQHHVDGEAKKTTNDLVFFEKSGKGIKPPMLKLTLKPYEEVTYEQIAEEQTRGVLKFDIRATTRHELKMDHCEKECSEVVDGLFVAGEKVAKSHEILKKHKIAVIINCAADYCENWFEGQPMDYLNGEQIEYETFFLKDSQQENIECLFYKAIEFIQNAQKSSKNILVHCIQGISRSISIVASFLIFKYGYDYKKTELFLKQKRSVACPNNGFMVELIQFYKRLYEEHSALPLPRVFFVSAHSAESPNLIVARLLKHSLFEAPRYVGFDARGLYLIQSLETIYIWVGSRCEERRLQSYWTYAQAYVKKLQNYERGPLKIKAISQGSEGLEFFSLWGLTDPPKIFENSELNKFFIDSQPAKPGALRKNYERESDDSTTAKLFIFPDFHSGLGVFEFEDLLGFCVLANRDGEKLYIFVWGEPKPEEENFLDDVLKTHFSNYDPQQIIIIEENENNPSESFMACFS